MASGALKTRGPVSLDTVIAAASGPEGIIALLSKILGHGRSSAASDASARRLLRQFGSISILAQASHEEIRKKGRLSNGQAGTLRAALTLASQACAPPLRPGEGFASSRDLYQRYRARFYAAGKEYFLSLNLNSKNQLIREVLVSVGSLSTSVVHPREVFSAAIRDSSASTIFLHNHPSGDPAPSREDKECTLRLCRAGKILGIRVLDHIVVGYDDYFSFADSGLLNTSDFSRCQHCP